MRERTDRAGGALRRKVAVRAAPAAEDGGARAFRLALARAAHDEAALDLDVGRVAERSLSLAEFLELTPDRALIAVLEGPEGALGAMVLSAPLCAALVEVQTIGRVTAGPAPARRPTRTDAAMVAATVERCLREVEAALTGTPAQVWSAGFHYGSFVADPRPLGLVLEDEPLRILSAEVTVAGAARTGTALLALPAAGRGPRPTAPVVPPHSAAAEARVWSAALAAAVSGAEVRLDAVVARLRLPLAQATALAEGAVLALPQASLDTVTLEAPGGRVVAEARLGQNRGMRALRLTRTEEAGGLRAEPPAPPARADGAAAVDPRAAAPSAAAQPLARSV